MLQLRNETPFAATLAAFPNQHGIDTLYLVVKASFSLWPLVALRDEQEPLVLADEYYDEPGQSSLKAAGELHLGKPGTDVVLRASAKPQSGKAVSSMRVQVKVAERKKDLLVLGDREVRGAGSISQPAPFDSMPLIYERAFGGCLIEDGQPPRLEPRNPVGVGLSLALKRAQRGDKLPNLEDPAHPIRGAGDHPVPCGVGFVAASWEPRRSFGGTYDARWQRERAPFFPKDFDLRHFQSACPELTFDRHLRGGEPVHLTGVSERGPLSFALPTCTLPSQARVRGREEPLDPVLETVLVAPDDNLLSLTFRAALACDKTLLQVEEVRVVLGQSGSFERCLP